MEQKDIDVYEILKDVPKGTEFYTSLCGNVGLAYLESNKEAGEAIWTKNKDGEYSFNKNGRWMKGGEVTFFPSKQMRDWSKFFKKGDVLEYAGDDEGLQGSCTFEKFEDETKTRFLGRYVKEKEALYSKRPSSLRTADWVKSDDPADYIRFVEERLGGKLNRETLEIEKQLEFKDGDIVALVVRKCTHIAIFQSRQEAYIGFHAVLCQNDELLLEEPFREDVGDIELRLATDSEKQQLFDALAKEGKAWDAEKKQIVDLKPAFEIGKLYVFDEEDEDGKVMVIGKLIAKNESEDTLTFGNQYEIETEKFVTDQAFDLDISLHEVLREATENEVELFNKHYAIWKEQPCFKTFDKVLVSIGSGFKWRPALFIRDHGENCTNRYNVLPLYSGKPADFEHCIPYEGYENIAFADYNSEDLPLPF
ncbi:hypothetical protein [Leyella stercorea]|uniref:hypothetical protein n=1 Tax=Leyella stercorea TaxID=363265 RepID=UPI00242CF246|nr:hypothetical protein [Leyella stercorea]